jgi:seryl-tRNA synthetase
LLSSIKDIFLLNKQQKHILQNLQAQQNILSRQFGELKRDGLSTTELKCKLDTNKSLMQESNKNVQNSQAQLDMLSLKIPNFPDDDVLDGLDESHNKVIKHILDKPNFSFTPKEHWELSECNNWIDFKKGSKLAKSRFVVLNNEASKLERALVNYMLDFNRQKGFNEVSVPFIANRESLISTGQLPKFEDDLFKISNDNECDINDLFLIPTAEVPLVNIYRDEILEESELPILFTSSTPCFRKEAGSAGRDTRGMIRQHQFLKVELVSFCKPQDSDMIFDKMVKCASDLLLSLGLHHRLVELCTGDLGFSAAKTIDLEVWLPGQQKYREISSISNTRDFQARRGKIRYKENKKNLLINILNGSSLAIGRTLIAIMENNQTEDGTIVIPKVLEKYL